MILHRKYVASSLSRFVPSSKTSRYFLHLPQLKFIDNPGFSSNKTRPADINPHLDLQPHAEVSGKVPGEGVHTTGRRLDKHTCTPVKVAGINKQTRRTRQVRGKGILHQTHPHIEVEGNHYAVPVGEHTCSGTDHKQFVRLKRVHRCKAEVAF